MPLYVVYRHGFNDQNQSASQGAPEKMAVARVDAPNPEEACRKARPEVTLFGEQRLSAEPAATVDAKEQDLNRRVEAL